MNQSTHRSCGTLIIVVLIGLCSSNALGIESRNLLLDAQAQFQEQNFDKALTLYKQAAEEAPNQPSVSYNIGLCHVRLGDAEKATTQFETVTADAETSDTLRRDAFYNIGLLRTQSARIHLDELTAPSTQPADAPPPDSPANIEKLQSISEELLLGIDAFRQSQAIESIQDAEHNIRAARILRRNVLGMLKRAMEEKEKEEILDDPRAWLDRLIDEQALQVALGRWTNIQPPEGAREKREVRRAAFRAQRELMERTGKLSDNLQQYKEDTSDDPDAADPAQPSPKEQIYAAVVEHLTPAVESQRDACAFLQDGDTKEAYAQQRRALDKLRQAASIFPIEPGQSLRKWRADALQIRQVADAVENDGDWFADPLLSNTKPTGELDWPIDDSAIHDLQFQIGEGLRRLLLQTEYLATTTQPVEPTEPGTEPNPLLDKELNQQLNDILSKTVDPQQRAMDGILDREKEKTVEAEDELIELLTEAIRLLPRTIEERLQELIVQQNDLNEEVKSAVSAESLEGVDDQTSGSLLSKVKTFATTLTNKVLGRSDAGVAALKRDEQARIEQDTRVLTDEVKQQIPSGAQPGGPSPGGQSDPKVQAYIEAHKHMEQAGLQMVTAVEGLDKAAIDESLRLLRAEGPVQAAQQSALESLIKALMALQPPEQQENEQDDEQQQEQQQQQQDQSEDVRRALERMDREREREQQQLFQKKPRTVIKDW